MKRSKSAYPTAFGAVVADEFAKATSAAVGRLEAKGIEPVGETGPPAVTVTTVLVRGRNERASSKAVPPARKLKVKQTEL